ncbi:MAG: hypothetical protein FJ248_01040 [Nitrospira sp.]|nr:hypothetical protein [Nitrospira sp.]
MKKQIAVTGLMLALLSGATGCGWSPLRSSGDTQGYWLPLAVVLTVDRSVTDATLSYNDACQQLRTIAYGEQLTYALLRQIGLAFERVRIDPEQLKGKTDGTVSVTIGLQNVRLLIPRQADKSHDVTIELGATVTFQDAAGAVIYTKGIKTEWKGSVDSSRQNCDVRGLAEIVNEAALVLAQGVKSQLGTSIKIREYASQRNAARR